MTSTSLSPSPNDYQPRNAASSPLFRILQDHLETFLVDREGEQHPTQGYLRPEVRTTLERFMECGILRFGFARVKCGSCPHEILLPLSCQFRGFCPSCHARRLAEWSDSMVGSVLPDVRYRQWVLTWPKRIRVFFRFDDDLFRAVSNILHDVLASFMQTLLGEPEARPALVICDQTFGTLLDFHPHLHAIASHGLFRPDGTFVPMPSLHDGDFRTLERLLAQRILTLLVRRNKITPQERQAMLAWPHLGFSLDASVGVRVGNRDGLRRLLCYIYRHPFRLEGIEYLPEEETVIYRAHKPHGLKKTDTRVFEPLEFLDILSQHIPSARKHQVRYYGALHPTWRFPFEGGQTPLVAAHPELSPKEGRASWHQLIWRVYGVDALECPKCQGRMRILSILIHDPVVPKILRHLGLSTELPVTKPARLKARGPPESSTQRVPTGREAARNVEADFIPPDFIPDWAPSNEDDLIDTPAWEELSFDANR